MKIYTKKGDLGKTSIIGEVNMDKHHIRIESYGTIDELNSHLGLLRSFVHKKMNPHIHELIFIQNNLFTIGAALASKSKSKSNHTISNESIIKIEHYIDGIEQELAPLTSFILPGGDRWSSYAQIARAVCRRAERRITQMNTTINVDTNIIKFVNRLSDYLFVLSRKISSVNNIEEIKWLC
tara:strand:- start:111 stop:653 length:543 start_codon:yes stop_codon:yes gene_type:complete